MDGFGTFARAVNRFVASPAATAAAFLIVLVWALCGPAAHYSDGRQLIINTGTTIVTFLLVLVLNNAQRRDTSVHNVERVATTRPRPRLRASASITLRERVRSYRYGVVPAGRRGCGRIEPARRNIDASVAESGTEK
jgi:hypothetical protein